MTRRNALALMGADLSAPERTAVPPGISAVMARSLAAGPQAWNTDWFGTLLIKGLLDWVPLGFPEHREFARRWLDFHLASKSLSPYSGARARRQVLVGGVTLTTYAGHFGIAFPCYEMVRQMGDQRARRICLELAGLIVMRTSRNRLGMVNHDDSGAFAIPDVCYFVSPPLAMAARLDPERGWVYRDHAVFQLRTYIDTFLVRETGLARTILLNDGPGKTYWTRASGWLLWAITATLRYLPASDPAIPGFLEDLRRLAEGSVRVQDATGGFHVLLDDISTPLETTGTAMFGMAFHESVRHGWLPDFFAQPARRAWEFVSRNIGPDGKIVKAYTGWAVPAENRRMEMDQVEMGWIPGFILSAAAEMATS